MSRKCIVGSCALFTGTRLLRGKVGQFPMLWGGTLFKDPKQARGPRFWKLKPYSLQCWSVLFLSIYALGRVLETNFTVPCADGQLKVPISPCRAAPLGANPPILR